MGCTFLVIIGFPLGIAAASPIGAAVPLNMHPVKPVSRRVGGAELQGAEGGYFSYAKPSGWQLGEDGQVALTLVATDKKAFTAMVGNSGLPPNYNPGQFMYEKLMALRPQNLKRYFLRHDCCIV